MAYEALTLNPTALAAGSRGDEVAGSMDEIKDDYLTVLKKAWEYVADATGSPLIAGALLATGIFGTVGVALAVGRAFGKAAKD